MNRKRVFTVLAVCMVLASVASAAIPELINYQGLLTNAGGTPVPDGSYSVIFTIYPTPTGGTALWTETKLITTTDGLFSTMLGSVTAVPDSVFGTASTYLGIKVGADPEIIPRTQLTAVPYANRVGSLMGATGPVSVDTTSDTTFISPNLLGSGAEELPLPCPSLGTSPPLTILNIGGGIFSGRLFVNRNFGGGWKIFGDGSTGNFIAKGKGTFGDNHFNNGFYSFVAGCSNIITGGTLYATIPGGYQNTISGGYTVIGGGENNSAGGVHATISGGLVNSASNNFTTIGGGSFNSASDLSATVGGGLSNASSGQNATIGGGITNSASMFASTIAGGDSNSVTQVWGSIGGGQNNRVNSQWGTISGGQNNGISSGLHSAIGGGLSNGIVNNINASVIAGGASNNVSNHWSAIGGGTGNLVPGRYSVVGGGQTNIAGNVGNGNIGWWATVSGGELNTAEGSHSTVPGGINNTAFGDQSFAAGTQAKALHSCSFVWADCCSTFDFWSRGPNTFNVRATGGTYIYSMCDTNLQVGVQLPPGASAWTSLSDSTIKRNIRQVEGAEILEKLSQLPVSRWSYKAQDESIEHIGPMAQDFYRLFRLGEDEKRISTIDPSGIALAAAKALYALNQELQAKVSAQQTTIDELQQKTAEIDQLKSQLAVMSGQLSELLAAQSKTAGDTKLAANDKASQSSGK